MTPPGCAETLHSDFGRFDLMWMEAVLGLCLGCEVYGVMVRRGWRAPDDAFEVCANGAFDLDGAFD